VFLMILSVAIVVLVGLVSEPEKWPERISAFLREHNLHHG